LNHQQASNPNTGEWLLTRYRERPLLGLATLTAASEIAALTSFFKKSPDPRGSRFTIREAFEHFAGQAQAGDSDGLERIRKVRHYVALAGRPGSAPVVTLAAFVDGVVVVDGNHTAMAAYHRGIEGSNAVALPVFILDTGRPSSVLG
jgi:hypothetical protein